MRDGITRGLTNHFNLDGIVNEIGADEVQLAQADLRREHYDFVGSRGGRLRVGCTADNQRTTQNKQPQQFLKLHLHTWLICIDATAWPADA